MSPTVAQYLDALADVYEGGKYTDDPNDAGGSTKWGITQRTLSAYLGRPADVADVRSLTRQGALGIYRSEYVDRPGFNRLAAVSDAVAIEVIDTGVNMGVQVSTRFLQRALNVLNHGAADWHDVTVDGNCGPLTAGALGALVSKRGSAGVSVLIVALNCLQGAQYIHIAEALPTNEKYVYGWLAQRVQVRPC